MSVLNQDGLRHFWANLKNVLITKVDVEAGKGLSSNDYTTDEKIKLAGIEEGANKTVVEDVLTSTSVTNALSAAQGKALDDKIKAITTDIGDLGGGDMLKAVYDVNGDGVVDNAAQLGGQNPDYYAKAEDVPTSNSQLTNDAGYLTETEVQALLANVDHLKRLIVESLPETDIDVNTIYMVLREGSTEGDIYDEYMYINEKWETIGSSAADLSGYATTVELNNLKTEFYEFRDNPITNEEIDAICAE